MCVVLVKFLWADSSTTDPRAPAAVTVPDPELLNTGPASITLSVSSTLIRKTICLLRLE